VGAPIAPPLITAGTVLIEQALEEWTVPGSHAPRMRTEGFAPFKAHFHLRFNYPQLMDGSQYLWTKYF
jgi:hypothetical protein